MDKAEYQQRFLAKHPGYRAAYNASRRKPLQTKSCEECGESFATTRNSGLITKRFCSSDCREVRRRRRPGKSVGEKTRRRVLELAGWCCYLCRREMDPSLRWPHPLSATVDHFVPRSAGGSSRLGNLRASHWYCNKEKGDRLPGTEVWVPQPA